MSEELKLKEWSSAGKGVPYRFYKSTHKCPQCGGETLVDNWPPNYGGGNASYGPNTDYTSEYGADIKHVCVKCRISFSVYEAKKYINNNLVGEKNDVHDIEVLVEKDGYLLTPHDVWQEEYKDKHGQYPPEAYA